MGVSAKDGSPAGRQVATRRRGDGRRRVTAVTDPQTQEDWVRRFTATEIGFPVWNDAAPDHLALVTTRSGAWQAWSHDLRDGSWRQVSHEPVGVATTWMLPGDRVAWWRAPTGDERRLLVSVPFVGGEPEPGFPELPEGWLMGHSFEAGIAAISMEIGGAYRTYLIDGDGTSRTFLDHEAPAGVGSMEPGVGGGLSADGSLVCIRHAEHGDLLHAALRVHDTRTGEVVGELEDKGRNLDPIAWSPVAGDHRLAFTSELGTFERPAIWDVRTGERRDLDADLPSGVIPVRWWPDATAILARHEHEGRMQLVRIDLATGAATTLTRLDGDIDGADIRPDGSVWYRVSDSVRPPRIMEAGGGDVLVSPDTAPPTGRPYASRFATNPHGDRIHMFVVTPDGDGPFPTVFNIH